MNNTIPLWKSVFELAKKQMNNDIEFLKSKKIDKVDKVNEKIFQEYRFFKLKRTLNQVYSKSRFYRNLYDKNNVDLGEIKTMEDIKYLPFTYPKDLAGHEYDFLCISQGMVKRTITFVSSGTIGPKKRLFFTEDDIEAMTDFMSAGMNTVTDENGVTQIFLPSGPSMGQSDLLGRGVKKMKGRFIAKGMLISSKEQVETIIKNKTTVLFGETRLIYRITKEMEKKYDLKSLGVNVIFVTTSYVSKTVREYLEKAWNARVSSHYGLVEMGLGVAVECERGCGYHYNELDLICEGINTKTNEVVYNEESELCFTSITRQALPLIRYRTRDIAGVKKGNKECRGFDAITEVKTRIEAFVDLGESKLCPTYFDNALFTIDSLIDYDICISNGSRSNVITINAETVNERNNISDEIIKLVSKSDIIRNEKKDIEAVRVEYLPKDSLKSEIHFKKAIKDLR